MGDVAMTAPIVASACLANPNVEFTVLSTPFFEPFFEPFPNFHFFGTDIRRQKHGLIALWQLFKTLRSICRFDTIIDLHNVLRSKVLRTLFRLVGSNVFVVDKGRADKKRLVSGKLHSQLTPMVERYRKVFLSAGLSCPDTTHRRPQEPIPSASPIKTKGTEIWIGISPFAAHDGKMYPLDKTKQVINLLLQRPDVRIFIFGGGNKEKALAQSLLSSDNHCLSVIGLMPLDSEMALMSNLDSMISMDSSAMHVCSLYGVRVVSVWGATHHFAGFLGYGQKLADVVGRDDLTCRPCSVYGNKPCRFADYRCFNIDPQKIVDIVLNN